MNDSKEQLEEWAELDCDSVDFDELEKKLDSELEEQMADLKGLELDREKIGSPDSIGETVMNVVWEQFINQVGVVAGEDFIKENRGLNLDLRDDAHIQTTGNFQGASDNNSEISRINNELKSLNQKINNGNASSFDKLKKSQLEQDLNGYLATHNSSIDYQKRYDDWQSNFQHDENGNVITHSTRSGKEETTLVRGARDPFDKERPIGSTERGTDMDHTVSAGEIIRNPAANAHMTREEQINFANSDANLNEMDAGQNRSKGDKSMTDWLDNPNKNGQKPNEIFDISDEQDKQYREKDAEARAEYEKRKKEGEQRSIETGKQSQKEEAMRIGGKALRAVVMGLLASLIKDIIRKLVKWFRSGNRKLSTFIESVKEAIKSFVSNIKEHLLTAGNTLVTTIATAIFGPVVGMIKKAWIFLKQGYKSVKEAIHFLKDPANKNMPFSLKMMNVGKIVIVGLTAGGAIVLGEVIEKGLMAIPGFAFEIPLLGSLASIIGMFLGALVSGLIGALALNLIDRVISKKLKKINMQQQIEKKGDIIKTQGQLIVLTGKRVEHTRTETFNNIKNRHAEAADAIETSIQNIMANSEEINTPLYEDAEIIEDESTQVSENEDSLNDLFDMINTIK